MADYITIMKKYHTALRRTQHDHLGNLLEPQTYSELQYQQDLTGKGMYGIDWKKEMKRRTMPP